MVMIASESESKRLSCHAFPEASGSLSHNNHLHCMAKTSCANFGIGVVEYITFDQSISLLIKRPDRFNDMSDRTVAASAAHFVSFQDLVL